MTTQPICRYCVHYKTARFCEAFSGPIPDVIWSGKSAHLTVISGQREPLTFEPRPGSEDAAAAVLERLEHQS
jgi:hypothetical protein